MEPRVLPTVRTGIPEFDVVLRGGLPRDRMHLLEGAPGTGKTTIAMRFLMDGAALGERTIYVTLSESEEELRSSAATHGWALDGVLICEIVPVEAVEENQQSVLYPAEVEFLESIRRIITEIEKSNADRVVIDSLAELRLLAQDSLPYRRQLLYLKKFLQGRKTTTLLLDDLTTNTPDNDVHSLVHGVIILEQTERQYGASRRRLRIAKMRGSAYQSGWHDFAMVTGEVYVFPSLIAEEHKTPYTRGVIQSGVADLDELLGGGLDRGTTTILVGPSGAGKSSMALRFVVNAATQNEHAAYFSFDETYETLERRAIALGLPIKEIIANGTFTWHRANPSRLSPGEFVWRVRREVEDKKARVVIIDSLNSYFGTMPEEHALVLHMHELLTYLNNKGIMTIMILAQQGVVGDAHNPIDLSFLSDTVVLLRFFEAGGQLRKAISVIKKRTGVHQVAIREYSLFPNGLRLGPPLEFFHGVLTGVPNYRGPEDLLIKDDKGVA